VGAPIALSLNETTGGIAVAIPLNSGPMGVARHKANGLIDGQFNGSGVVFTSFANTHNSYVYPDYPGNYPTIDMPAGVKLLDDGAIIVAGTSSPAPTMGDDFFTPEELATQFKRIVLAKFSPSGLLVPEFGTSMLSFYTKDHSSEALSVSWSKNAIFIAGRCSFGVYCSGSMPQLATLRLSANSGVIDLSLEHWTPDSIDLLGESVPTAVEPGGAICDDGKHLVIFGSYFSANEPIIPPVP